MRCNWKQILWVMFLFSFILGPPMSACYFVDLLIMSRLGTFIGMMCVVWPFIALPGMLSWEEHKREKWMRRSRYE